MKKIIAIAAAAALMCTLTACGEKAAEVPETTVLETISVETAPMETVAETEAVPVETTAPAVTEAEMPLRTDFADNFDVDSASAAIFAGKIQAVVAQQDLEALSQLAAYPLYVGFADGGVSVTSAEEFLDLGAERIFTAELLASIENAPTEGLTASKAGFSLTAEGRPNIIFGVRDGALAVQGINY